MKVIKAAGHEKKGFFLFNWVTLKESASMAAAVVIKKGKHVPLNMKSIICPRNKT